MSFIYIYYNVESDAIDYGTGFYDMIGYDR
jgi:hypothetical protein